MYNEKTKVKRGSDNKETQIIEWRRNSDNFFVYFCLIQIQKNIRNNLQELRSQIIRTKMKGEKQ